MISKLFPAFLLPVLLIAAEAVSQGGYEPNLNIPVQISGSNAANPWAGGLNGPMFSAIDMNGDSRKDLFIFDKEGGRITTYINNGTPNTVDYKYAPEYIERFPDDLHDWVILKDYNCDGLEDIFTYSYSGGMTVYRNDYTTQNGLQFTLMHSLIYSDYGPITSNLYVSPINLPGLADIDFDGDLDVLTFPVSGNFVEHHINQAQELFNRCDTLVYALNQNQYCWGNFGLSGLSNTAILGITCRVSQNIPQINDHASSAHGALHAGSCMLAWDSDGDMDIDLINGDVLGNNLLFIENGGNSQAANMTSQDSLFPVYDTPVNLITFPAPYYIDVNNDGNKDLIVAPCISSGSAENFNNVLYYRNTTNNTTNVFSYQQDRLLSDGMIEVGTAARPVFEDIDSDGLMDIVVGNLEYFDQSGTGESGLAYYRNNGTQSLPSFELITIDFGNFFQLPNIGLYPAFGDIDNDGDADLFMGEEEGKLFWYNNTAGAGNPPVYVLQQAQVTNSNGSVIDVGNLSAPQLADLNRDGKLDLVIGEKSGNLNYYENTGSATVPEFTFSTDQLGGVNVKKSHQSIYGYSQPFFYDSLGVWKLLVGSLSGYLYYYDNIDNNLSGSFNLIDSAAYGIYEPAIASVYGANIDTDPYLELVVGNAAGGITLYDYSTASNTDDPVTATYDFTVYPNPVFNELYVKFKGVLKERRIIIFDAMGKYIYEVTTRNNVEVIDTSDLSNGIYFCHIADEMGVQVGKFIVRR